MRNTDDDVLDFTPTIGAAVPTAAVAKKPDDSYRTSRVGFRGKETKAT